jgi:hypothetical protein
MVAPRLEQGKGHSGSLRHETLHAAPTITPAIRAVKWRARSVPALLSAAMLAARTGRARDLGLS